MLGEQEGCRRLEDMLDTFGGWAILGVRLFPVTIETDASVVLGFDTTADSAVLRASAIKWSRSEQNCGRKIER